MQRQPAVFDLAELVGRLNAVAGGPRWDRWTIRTLLKAYRVQLTQKAPHGKLYVTLDALRGTDVYESLLDAESLARASNANDDDDYGRPVQPMLSVG